jgi:DnaJ-class molecular chaperone
MQLNLPGYGNFIRDGQPGDLFIMIEEIPDPKFKREGCDLNCDEWVTISEAVLGSKINIDTPHGKLSIDVPAGCESGKVFEIRGKGIPNLSSNGTSNGQGNLKVKVNVKIPKISTPEQRDVFEKLKNYL